MSEVNCLSESKLRVWRSMQLMQMRLERDLARQLAADSDLSYPDYLVLTVLTENSEGRLRANEISATLSWEKSRLSHHVTRMVNRGLVSKEECPSDRRGSYVRISDRGRRAIEAAAPKHLATVRRLFIDLLTPERLECLADISETVLSNLDAFEDDTSE